MVATDAATRSTGKLWAVVAFVAFVVIVLGAGVIAWRNMTDPSQCVPPGEGVQVRVILGGYAEPNRCQYIDRNTGQVLNETISLRNTGGDN